jgi:hypothetical protein
MYRAAISTSRTLPADQGVAKQLNIEELHDLLTVYLKFIQE